MALHGQIKVNEIPIGYWEARRTEPKTEGQDFYHYECRVALKGQGIGFTIPHYLSEGALALTTRVLTYATQAGLK